MRSFGGAVDTGRAELINRLIYDEEVFIVFYSSVYACCASDGGRCQEGRIGQDRVCQE